MGRWHEEGLFFFELPHIRKRKSIFLGLASGLVILRVRGGASVELGRRDLESRCSSEFDF